MKCTKYILLFAGLMVGGALCAQKSEADFILMTKDYTLYADGSYDMHCQKQLKLHTHISFNSLYGETFIVYNPQYQQVKINHCYTVQQDGKKIEAPANAFNEVLPSFAAYAPAWNHLRELVVTHTGLELGATIYLDYTIHTAAGYNNGIMANEVLQETSPVKEYRVSIETPAGVEVYYNQYHCPAPVKKGNKLVWTLKNIPAASREPWQPADGRELPRVAFTTIGKMQVLAQLAAQITPAGRPLQEKTIELIDKEGDMQKRAGNIISYVVHSIATVQVPLEHTGYLLRPVDEVFRTAYGTPVEKSVLLASMLTLAGIDATPVFTMPDWAGQGKADPAFWLCNAGEYPVYYEIGYDSLFASPLRAGAYPWSGAGKLMYALGKNTGREIPYISKEVELRENFRMPDKDRLQKNGDYLSYALPAPRTGVDSWGIRFLSAEPRKTLLEIPVLMNEEDVYICPIPEGYCVVNRLTDLKIANQLGAVQIVSKTDKAANTLIITRSIQLKEKEIEPAAYKAFKELMDLWNTPVHRSVLFKPCGHE